MRLRYLGRHKQFYLLACGFLLTFASVSFSDSNFRWEFIGPGIRAVNQIVNDRQNPDIWFVVLNSNRFVQPGQLYRSLDGARTWETAFDKPVSQVLLHPRSSEVLIIASESSTFDQNGLWKSTDHGSTFVRIADFPFPFYAQTFFHPANSHILYAFSAHDRILLISDDQGKNWKKKSILPGRLKDCNLKSWHLKDLLVSPLNHNTVYTTAVAWCGPPGEAVEFLLVSENGGLRWKIEQQLPKGTVKFLHTRFHYDPAFPQRAYLYGDNGLRVLTATGWNLISTGPLISRLASVPGEPQHLFITQGGWLYESKDGGASREKIKFDLNGNVRLLQSTVDGRLIAGNEMGIYHFEASKNWKPRNHGLVKQQADFKIDVSAGKDSRLFTLVRETSSNDLGFLYRREPGAKAWNNLVGKYQIDFGRQPFFVEVSPVNSDHVILFDGTSAMFSTDGGKTWKESSLPYHCEPYPDCSILPPVFDPNHENVVYLLIDSTVLKSTDGGAKFEVLPISGQILPSQLLIDEWNSNELYFLGEDLFKSTDGGQTIQRTGLDRKTRGITGINRLPFRGGYLAITYRGNIFRTLNGGAKWTRVARVNTYRPPDPEICRYQGRCYADKIWAENEKHWYVITRSSGDIYETSDAGNSWTRINDQFGEALISEITDPRKRPFYAATNMGVFAFQKVQLRHRDAGTQR